MTTKTEKLRRMQIRRGLGNRAVHYPVQGSDCPEHLIAFACFECRKSFKKAINYDAPVCPQCDAKLEDMGRTFKTPKMKDVEQWTKVQRSWEAGFRFTGCGSHGGPPFPKRLSEVDEFIANNPDHPLRFEYGD